ncbi:universal stress protein [Acidocella aminolytica]|jgi:nucleotide-binding universal stress UspA family protein|uniref:Universal stress protein UspA n=1 Tax=Acidocella aminolytica 101 = DSM 11237 TaxID=1120923 RepID=A0A0D6PFY8_9PROT|nr:universal stress protein [Acidocella aminolytica]GAN80286.1 universal stress protein UspA [Acidocella aminolytica 101 = DSM 11237]GBQ44780.1 universal stress protein UspA [Acidocella aminolytica 101 = DSM 11237]SHE93525.1 Universal stress protein family protein [Acidocella aminolytica 101 = DSM 11237]
MSVRKFLLPVSSTASAEAALQAGLLLARMWNAHLEVLYVQSDTREIAPFAGEGLSSALIEDMMTATEREGGARAQSLQELFRAATDHAAVPVGAAHRGADEPSASFTTLTGREEMLVAHKARLADLTIVPHPLAGEDVAAAEALHAVLFDSGRPVLLAPVAPPLHIGKRIAIAWNGTANAASALASAMAFIRQGDSVCVLSSEEYCRPGPSPEDVREYISHHGVEADIARFRSVDRNIGAGLLAAAGAFGADLMVMGAYSTASRLRQLILGGITRHVLENAEICVLMNR